MTMNTSGIGRLFFFDQPFQLYKRRSKIPADSLPFQVKELKSLSSSKTKLESNVKLKSKDTEGLESLPEASSELEGIKKPKSSSTSTDSVFRKALEHEGKGRRKFSFNGIKVIGGIRLSEDDEEEDTQKFLFEETKFSAPNILFQLTRVLDQILNRKQTEEKEAREFYAEIERTHGEPLYENCFQCISLAITLPNDLYLRLSRTYEDLIKDITYTKRLWQSSSYRDAVNSDELTGNTDSALVSNITSTTSTSDRKMDSKEKTVLLQEKDRRIDIADSLTFNSVLQEKESKDSGRASDFDPPSIIAYRGESKTLLTQNLKPKTRAEKFKVYHIRERAEQNKSSSARQQIQRPNPILSEYEGGEDLKEAKQRDDKFVIPPLYGPTTVINFTMSSRQCIENGWIKMQNKTEDPERQTLLEWARGRLQCSMLKKEQQEELARKRNEDGPLTIQYYGDAKRDVAIRYKKGVAMGKKLAQMTDNKRPRFLTILPDHGGYCLYPSGRIAVSISKKGYDSNGFYTFVFSDSFPAQMLASFTPTGHCCCNFQSGTLRFVCTESFAACHEEDGTVSRKWKWSSGKLMPAIILQINEIITLKCSSLTSMVLYVKSQGETTKFNVGATDISDIEKEASSPDLRPKTVPDRKKSRFGKDKKTQKGNSEVSDEVMAERLKELGEKFPERKGVEFDTPDCRDLYRLRYRVRNLVNDWLDHYRITTGMTATPTSPSRSKRKDKAHSAASLPMQMPSSSRRHRKITERAPSAPPIPKAISYRSCDPKNQMRPHSSATDYDTCRNLKKTDKRFIRLEGVSSPRGTHHNMEELDEILLPKSAPPPINSGPFRCGLPQQKARTAILPKEGCPIALRMEMLGHNAPQCRCDKRSIPYISDLEFDVFLQRHLPKTQLLVVVVGSSKHQSLDACEQMLDDLYYEKNKGRSFPCVQSRNDPFRLLRYDIDTACPEGNIPVLQKRHNVVPGMSMMYTAGKLIFADYIFNGYGNARKDFLKQVTKSRKGGLKGVSLPQDFKFDPRPTHCGNRTAWGGEIGTPILITQGSNYRVGGRHISNVADVTDSLHSFHRYKRETTPSELLTGGLMPHSLYEQQGLSLLPNS